MPAKRSTKKAAAKTRKTAAKKAAPRAAAKRASSGRAGTAGKGEGRAAVTAWIKAVKPAHKPIVQRIAKIVAEEVPDVRYAIKWSTPMFGREGVGWFAALASFKEHVGVNFFNGVALKPEPPLGSSKLMRGIRIETMDDLDETQLRAWMRQAAAQKGWGKIG